MVRRVEIQRSGRPGGSHPQAPTGSNVNRDCRGLAGLRGVLDVFSSALFLLASLALGILPSWHARCPGEASSRRRPLDPQLG
jgi:hypothetical protein